MRYHYATDQLENNADRIELSLRHVAYPMDKKPFAWVVLPLHYTLKIGARFKLHIFLPQKVSV